MSRERAWIEGLADEDLAFIRRFVLASGSLKEMAKVYGVSYPTVRRRLDRIMTKIAVLDERRDESPLERSLRLLYAEGRLDEDALSTLLAVYRREQEAERCDSRL